ncbi:MAG: acetyl-CoA hydrolase/transferase C-terminal domain-containing protein, partial [Actinomycetota bacterium]
STTDGGRISRISPTLKTGAVVTTPKNTVDNVVTEHGVAELQGRTVAERARALIAVAAPHHRDELSRAAKELGLVH